MKILLDECLDRRLLHDLFGHEPWTTPQKGWAGLSNGQLLIKAAAEFDVFFTVDRNLSLQQNVVEYPIAILVLKTKSNRIADLRPLDPAILKAIPRCIKGTVTIVE